jgi:hypothetical protein
MHSPIEERNLNEWRIEGHTPFNRYLVWHKKASRRLLGSTDPVKQPQEARQLDDPIPIIHKKQLL